MRSKSLLRTPLWGSPVPWKPLSMTGLQDAPNCHMPSHEFDHCNCVHTMRAFSNALRWNV